VLASLEISRALAAPNPKPSEISPCKFRAPLTQGSPTRKTLEVVYKHQYYT
jgi:hypothetical protein